MKKLLKDASGWILLLGFLAILSTCFAACNHAWDKDVTVHYNDNSTHCDSLAAQLAKADTIDTWVHQYIDSMKNVIRKDCK